MDFQLVPTRSLDFQVALNLGETASLNPDVRLRDIGNMFAYFRFAHWNYLNNDILSDKVFLFSTKKKI